MIQAMLPPLDVPIVSEDDPIDAALTNAFERATRGGVSRPNLLQAALFPRLVTRDTGLLVRTDPGDGLLEAVFVPTLLERAPGRRHRLFIIARNDAPLDDYLYRLVPYLRLVAATDETSRTLYVDGDNIAPGVSRKYTPDGLFVDQVGGHPLDRKVDLAISSLSEFRNDFFGAGGVHALPEALTLADEEDMVPRDLFFFDDVIGYDQQEYAEFIRLVDYLYARDLDVLVGGPSIGNGVVEALSFLELIQIDVRSAPKQRTLNVVDVDQHSVLDTIKDKVVEGVAAGRAVVAAVSSPERAEALEQKLRDSVNVETYLSNSPTHERYARYVRLKALNADHAEGVAIVGDGNAIEAADFDCEMLVTDSCPPEALLRRIGRCNRLGQYGAAVVFLVGGRYGEAGERVLPADRVEAYHKFLSSYQGGGSLVDLSVLRDVIG
jgi:CRISPR-associated endonuclease/helicase Cas3